MEPDGVIDRGRDNAVQPQDSPCVVMIESSTVVSDEYASAATWISGSSGSRPSARIHTRL